MLSFMMRIRSAILPMCANFCKDVRIETSHLARIISSFAKQKQHSQKMAVTSVMILLELLITYLPLIRTYLRSFFGLANQLAGGGTSNVNESCST